MPNSKKYAIFGALLALFVASLGMSSPVVAHDSSYCGHGTSGYVWITQYQHSHNRNNTEHEHVHDYEHYYNDGTERYPPITHGEHAVCPPPWTSKCALPNEVESKDCTDIGMYLPSVAHPEPVIPE